MSSVKPARNASPSNHVEAPYVWDLDNRLGYANRIGRYRTEVESQFLFEHIGKPPQRILDMGGGSGRLGGMLAARGHAVTLIDNNPQAVAMAEKRGIRRAIVSDISDFQDVGFDGIVCMEVVEYFESCDTVISKASELLKTGGMFVFCVTNSQSWRFRLRSLKKHSSTVHAFPIHEIEGCLKSRRFEVLGRKGFSWSLAQTGSDSRIVDASIWIEKGLGLQNWLSQSPWLLYACRKIAVNQ